VLLGGASIASVDWSHAAHPWLACLLIGLAIVAAFGLVTLASFVISPGCTVETLRQKEDVVQRRLQRQVGGSAVTWTEIASADRGLLRALYNAGFKRSANDLWAAATAADDVARKDLESMVALANGWLAHYRFRALRYVTPVAAVIILAGGIAWKPLTAPPASHGVRSASSSATCRAVPRRLIVEACSSRAFSVVTGEAIEVHFSATRRCEAGGPLVGSQCVD
jgi:hypothetical protein